VRDDPAEPLSGQGRELEDLRLELARAHGHIEALRTQLEVRSLEPTELREIALNLEQQLAERDEELEKLRKELSEGDEWRREMEAEALRLETARREAEEWSTALRKELDEIKSTRLWSVIQRYWALGARVRRRAS
jgi:chromosome segregation ATPase